MDRDAQTALYENLDDFLPDDPNELAQFLEATQDLKKKTWSNYNFHIVHDQIVIPL